VVISDHHFGNPDPPDDILPGELPRILPREFIGKLKYQEEIHASPPISWILSSTVERSATGPRSEATTSLG